MQVLNQINSPEDLRRLDANALPALAEEIRQAIIETVSRNGGHLASNLGVVEMTIALLRVFDPPRDKLLFDVSHQAYAYKLLTGRRDAFASIRQTDGLSGFMKRTESKYDVFGAGHAGTAISAGLGFAVDRDQRGSSEAVVAVVGDASLANGISLEGLNNVSDTTKAMIIVLNDNKMSISRNVGALSHAFGRMLANPRYNRVKSAIEDVGIRKLRMSWLRKHYHRLERTIKSLFLQNTPFEHMGIRYMGPIDGHNIQQLINAFQSAKASKVPVLIHVGTQKGLGYEYAAKNPERWHGAKPFDIATGCNKGRSDGTSWSTAFGEALTEMAASDKRIIAITAGMEAGTGLSSFHRAHSDRFHDVGICESHQMTFASGLAAAGLRPVVAVYSTFIQRAIDGIIHDIALQELPVLICLDRAGVVPGDGPTHHGIYDIALLRPIPNIVIMQPRTVSDLTCMLRTAFTLPYPVVIRYPRATCTNTGPANDRTIPVGRAVELERIAAVRHHPDLPGYPVAIWTLGPEDAFSSAVAKLLAERGIGTIRVDARFAKPIDGEMLRNQASEDVRVILTFEDAVVNGGFGSAVETFFAESEGKRPKIVKFGWPDAFIPHASSKADLMQRCGITPECAAERVLVALSY